MPDRAHGNYMSTTCLCWCDSKYWRCRCWHGNDVAVDLVDTFVSIMADVAEPVIPSEQCCVLTIGVWLKLGHGTTSKILRVKGCENGRSPKLTLVWADWSIYHLDKSWSIMMSKVLERSDPIEKCTGMVLETWVGLVCCKSRTEKNTKAFSGCRNLEQLRKDY